MEERSVPKDTAKELYRNSRLQWSNQAVHVSVLLFISHSATATVLSVG